MSETADGAPTEQIYDVVVLGAGPVSVVLAERTRAAALSVAVVERELVGGECQYWACIPSKALLRPVVAVADALRVQGAREAVNGPVDSAATFARRDGFVTHWRHRRQRPRRSGDVHRLAGPVSLGNPAGPRAPPAAPDGALHG